MGKLLVSFGHGQQRHGQLGVGCCSAMADGREGFPRLRGDVQCLEQSQGPLNRSGNAPQRVTRKPRANAKAPPAKTSQPIQFGLEPSSWFSQAVWAV